MLRRASASASHLCKLQERMKFISVQERFYINSCCKTKVTDHITFKKDAKQQAISEPHWAMLFSKKLACGFCKWNYTQCSLPLENVEFCVQTLYTKQHETAFEDKKKSLFEPSSNLIWPWTILLQWARFLLFVWTPVMDKEVWGKTKLLHAGIITVDVMAGIQRLGTDEKQTAVTIPHPEQRSFLMVACFR